LTSAPRRARRASLRLRRSLGLFSAALMTTLEGAIAAAYAGGPVDNAGSITGTIRYDGAPPEPVQLEVSKDREVCGAHPLYDQSLLVGAWSWYRQRCRDPARRRPGRAA
jgi:hypothetical protein